MPIKTVWCKKTKKHIQVNKPRLVEIYNRCMFGVGKLNTFINADSSMIWIVTFWEKLQFFFIEMFYFILGIMT